MFADSLHEGDGHKSGYELHLLYHLQTLPDLESTFKE